LENKGLLSGRQWMALGRRPRATPLERVAASEVTVKVEVVVDRGMNGGEFPQCLDVPEPNHVTLPTSERFV